FKLAPADYAILFAGAVGSTGILPLPGGARPFYWRGCRNASGGLASIGAARNNPKDTGCQPVPPRERACRQETPNADLGSPVPATGCSLSGGRPQKRAAVRAARSRGLQSDRRPALSGRAVGHADGRPAAAARDSNRFRDPVRAARAAIGPGAVRRPVG